MLWNLFLASALAGTVIIDNEIPVEVRIEQRTVMKLLYSAQARFEHSPGKTQLILLVNGKPKEIAVDIPETGSVRVIVGRNGISHTVDQTPVEAKEQTEVVFRALGSEPLQLRLGTKRHIVTPDTEFSTTHPRAAPHRSAKTRCNLTVGISTTRVLWTRAGDRSARRRTHSRSDRSRESILHPRSVDVERSTFRAFTPGSHHRCIFSGAHHRL